MGLVAEHDRALGNLLDGTLDGVPGVSTSVCGKTLATALPCAASTYRGHDHAEVAAVLSAQYGIGVRSGASVRTRSSWHSAGRGGGQVPPERPWQARCGQAFAWVQAPKTSSAWGRLWRAPSGRAHAGPIGDLRRHHCARPDDRQWPPPPWPTGSSQDRGGLITGRRHNTQIWFLSELKPGPVRTMDRKRNQGWELSMHFGRHRVLRGHARACPGNEPTPQTRT